MTISILYPEQIYGPEGSETRLFGPDVRVSQHNVSRLADLPDADCGEADALMLFRNFMTEQDFERFPRLKAIVRMGVGYDRIDRKAAAARNVTVCNVPDYCTTEVADQAMALAIGLRRGIFLHHDAQRRAEPAAWGPIEDPLFRRMSAQTFGILGLGRIGTAAALRAKAFGFRVVFHDPFVPHGMEAALGLHRAESLDALLEQSDVLSIHTPLTSQTRGMIGAAQIARLPRQAVLVNTARGPIVDIDAAADALRSGHLAGIGLDVIPVEPPRDPLPELVRAYRAREPWVEGRVVITPHAGFCSPEAVEDVQRRALEILHSVLFTDRPQNVIAPEMD